MKTTRTILLSNGTAVPAFELTALEADFDKMTWTFGIGEDTRIGAGQYYVIACRDVLAEGKSGSET